MQDIITRTVTAPKFRFPLGGNFELTLNVTGLSLTGKTVSFAAESQSSSAALERYLLDSVSDATQIAVSGSTITINIPPATPGNDDAEYSLSDLIAAGLVGYSVSITDDADDDELKARVQGDATWIRDVGKFTNGSAGAPSFDLTITEGNVISLEISTVGGGSTVDNESVNDAIEENPAATRTSLGLGSAALAASSAFATAAQGTAADAAKTKTDHLTVTQPVDLDTMESKLDGIEAGATADQTTAEIRTAYETERTLISQAEAEAGSETTVRLINALRMKQAIDARIAEIIDSSPTTLDTLNELAAALGDDPNFATTMSTALAGKQPIDATLTAFAALAGAANKLPYFSGDDTFTLADFTAAARTLLAAADAAAQRTALGLGTTDDVTLGGLSIPSTYNETQQNLIGSVWFGENGYGTQLRAYQTHFSFGNSIYANGMCLVGNYLGVEKLGVGAVFDPTVFFGSPSLGVGEINNGTTGQYRDLIARDLRASQYLRPASFTVAAANALSSPPAGSIIYVSDEAGGARPAYQTSGWKVFADDSAIA